MWCCLGVCPLPWVTGQALPVFVCVCRMGETVWACSLAPLWKSYLGVVFGMHLSSGASINRNPSLSVSGVCSACLCWVEVGWTGFMLQAFACCMNTICWRPVGTPSIHLHCCFHCLAMGTNLRPLSDWFLIRDCVHESPRHRRETSNNTLIWIFYLRSIWIKHYMVLIHPQYCIPFTAPEWICPFQNEEISSQTWMSLPS